MTWWPDERLTAGFWYGPLGGLVPLPNLKGELSYDGSPEVTLRRYGRGKRRAMVATAGPRQWSVSLPGAYPDEAGIVKALARGVLGWSAHWWVTPQAAWQNLLTPAASELTDWTVTGGHALYKGGPVPTVDGIAVCVAMPDYTGTDWAYSSPLFPLNPDGGPFTASIYARAGVGLTAAMRVKYYDGAGNPILTGPVSASATTTTSSGPLERLVVTETPSGLAAGAHAGRIQFRGAAVVANPVVTWTPTAGPWALGEGCSAALLHSLSVTPSTIGKPGGIQSTETLTFTVSEVTPH